MPSKVIILKGLPASGKTTWALNYVQAHPGQAVRINKDDLRAMFHNGVWSKANEKFVLEVRDKLIYTALEKDLLVIVDDTNLNPRHEKDIREIANLYDAQVEVKFFDVPLDVALARDSDRGSKSVGRKVITSMYLKYINPNNKIPIKNTRQDRINYVRSAIIVDLDGTLAYINGRDPYDGSLCESDLINAPVAVALLAMLALDRDIVFVSGRSDKNRDKTEAWLRKHFGDIDFILFMRKEGDYRKDEIIKKEIFENEIEDNWFIEFVLDDRNRVVDMWRSIGIPCFQVAYGEF